MKKIAALILALVLGLGLMACGGPAESIPAAEIAPAAATPTPESSAAPIASGEQAAEAAAPAAENAAAILAANGELFTDRDLEGTYEDYVTVTLADGASRADGEGVTIQGDVITVTQEGTYLLKGALTNGQIAVAAGEDAKVQLVLAGADISCAGGAALYIPEGDKIFLTLAPGTENRLASAGEFAGEESEGVDGAVFSRSDLTMNGAGALAVECESGHGVVGKDDLKLTGGRYLITAAGKGLEANDSIRMAAGEVTIRCGGDGVQAEHEDTAKGYVYLAGGSLTVQSGGDGVSATGTLLVTDGVLSLTTGDETTAQDASAKALKSDTAIVITGGDITAEAVDDGVHTNGDVTISGTAKLLLYSGDDAVHADNTVTIAGGSVEAPVCYEGLEGTNVTISGGYVSVVAWDDGVNAGGGADGSGFGGRGGSFEASGEAGGAAISISGGEVHVNAAGDGLDSNGALYISGGEVYVSGPVESMNGTLDFDGAASITGGTLVGTGPNSWLQNFGQSSTQGSIVCAFSGRYGEGTVITLTDDATGQTLASYTAEKTFQSVIVSAPELAVGGSYTITAGEESQSVTLTELQYGGGMGGGMGGKGGHGGR